MGSSEKLLLVKFEGGNCRSRVVIPSAGGAFVLDLASATGLDSALKDRKFSVIVADVRAHTGDLAPLIKKLRGHQAKACLLVLSDQIELVGDNIAVQVDQSNVSLELDIEHEMARYRK